MQYRWIIAGGFGLIHGAGFSGHLTELLKSVFGIGNIWSPLIGFNLGIEAGQFAVILLIYPGIRFVQIKKKQDLIVHKQYVQKLKFGNVHLQKLMGGDIEFHQMIFEDIQAHLFLLPASANMTPA